MQVKVNPPPAFHIFYATGWQEPILHALQLSSGKESKVTYCPYTRLRLSQSVPDMQGSLCACIYVSLPTHDTMYLSQTAVIASVLLGSYPRKTWPNPRCYS